MKSKILSVMCVLLCVLLCGCAEMPDSLKNDDKSDSTVYSREDFADYGDLDVIRNQLENDMSKSYDNLKVKYARVGAGNVMPTYDIIIGQKEGYDMTGLLTYLYGDRFDLSDESLYFIQHKGELIYPDLPPYKEPYCDENGIITNPNFMEYDLIFFEPSEDDVNLSCNSKSFGNMFGSATGFESFHYQEYVNRVESRYDFQYDTIPNDLSYTMSDGSQWNVLKAKEYIEGFWNDQLADSDPVEYTYIAKTLWVLKIGSDKFGYLFEMHKQDTNGNFYDTESRYVRDFDAIESGEPFIYEINGLTTWCESKESIDYFEKCQTYKPGEMTNSGDKLISLRKATDILSCTLAPNVNLKLTAELNYVTVCKGYPFYQLWEYPLYYWDICLNQCEFEIKPYWCFRTESSEPLLDLGSCEIYFVDAVTGDVEIMKNVSVTKIDTELDAQGADE